MLNVFAGTPTCSAASLNVGVREEALCACSILMTLSAEFFWHSDPKAGRLNCFLLDARGPVYQARLSPHLPNSSPFMGFRSILFGAARAVRTSGGRLPWRESGFPPVEKKNTLPMQSAAFTRHSNCTQRSKLQPGRSTREAAARAFCLTPKGHCRAGDVIDQVDTCVILITCAGLCPTLHKSHVSTSFICLAYCSSLQEYIHWACISAFGPEPAPPLNAKQLLHHISNPVQHKCLDPRINLLESYGVLNQGFHLSLVLWRKSCRIG